MQARNREAVVIGAGLGGLAVALRLATRGWRVTICEQAGSPGGKMNRWEAAGYRFDTGPSLITLPQALTETFQAAGERIEDYLELMPVSPLAEYFFDDGARFTHTSSLPPWLATVRRLEAGDASGFLRFMNLGARLFELSRRTFLARSPWEGPDPKALGALRYLPLRQGFGQYHRVVCDHFRSPYLQRMFDRYTTYVGSSPYHTPSTLIVIPYMEYAIGAWHVRGGLYQIVEALVALAQKNGVELRLGTCVQKIIYRQKRAIGVELGTGEQLPAEAVIMNGDASCLPHLLGLKGAQPLPENQRSLSGLIFLFALRRSLPEWSHHSVFFSADYAQEFHELFQERRFPEDPTIYINMPSRTDRSLTPGQGEALFIMANAPANDAEPWDEIMIGEARRRILRRLQKAGFPDFTNEVVAADVWTPRRIAEQYAMPGGAIYGTNSHGLRNAFLRPPNKDRRINGLYCVGGSSHPGGGVPTVLMSAAITARLVEKYEGP